MNRAVVLLIPLLFFAGCASGRPRLLSPNRVESFCGGAANYARETAIESVVTSTADLPEHFPVPEEAQIRHNVRAQNGVIAHWDDQDLYLPKVAKQYGYSGDYVRLGEAAITNRMVGVDSRRVYLTLILPDGSRKTLPFRAYDIQNICSEAKLSA
ncbi:MAG: hypothetical protein WCE44_12025 [Candidatus Velthaea sp.]|jgi:hypothetical protein